jgi:hypothetical protein
MYLPKRHLSKHRRARLIAWTLAILAWLAWAFSAERAPQRRHMRRRYGFISLEGLARTIALLVVSRAGELACMRRRANPFFARVRGRQRWPRHIKRSIIGARLRRRLKHPDFATRVAILAAAAANLDAWATAHIKKLRRGMTRLWAIAPASAPAAPLITLVRAPTFFADSS